MPDAPKPVLDGTRTTFDWQRLALPVCVLPIGAYEQHSYHLPLLSDAIQAEYFARHLAAELGAALLPCVPYGTSLEQTGFRGTVTLRPETLMQIVRDLADEMARQRFRIMVLVNGHGGNFCLGPVVRDINRRDGALKIILVAPTAFMDRSVLEKTAAGEDLHSGELETSMMLALAPDLVREQRADVLGRKHGGAFTQPDLNLYGFGGLSSHGPWGYPSLATREKGEHLVETAKAGMVAHVRERIEWLERDWRYCDGTPVVLRRMEAIDLDRALVLKDLAGWNQLRADWEIFLTLAPEGCFVAVANGLVVGTVTTLKFGAGAPRIGWVAMVLVDPDFRRRGIGTRLMTHAIEGLADCESAKLDATPAGRELYLTMGFHDEFRLSRMTTATVLTTGFDVGDDVVSLEADDLPAVAALDCEAFGADRTGLLRILLAGAPEYAVKFMDGDRLAGFALGRHGSQFEQIGPIVAGSAEVASKLLRACLNAAVGRRVVLDVPDRHTDLLGELARLGFYQQRPFIRMFRGEQVSGDTDRLFAAAGPELG